MKKREKGKPNPKPKEFATNVFGSLKGITAAKAKPEVQPPSRIEPVSEPEPDDNELFLRAMADVPRVGKAPKVAGKPRPAPQPRKIDDEERRIFMQALEKLELDVTFTDELPDDGVPPRPVPVNRMRQLRRGTIRIDYELDLHGLTRDEALESLARFVQGAHRRGQKAILVITGKGNNSEGEPVLQKAVDSWLRDQGKAMVAEFFPAPREMGGGGAFVVFLKSKS